MMDGGFTAHIVLKFKHDILHLFPLVPYIQNLMFSQGNCLLFKHTNIVPNFTTKNTHQCRTNSFNIYLNSSCFESYVGHKYPS